MLDDAHFHGCAVLDPTGAHIGTLEGVASDPTGIFAIVRTLQAKEQRLSVEDVVFDSGARTLTLRKGLDS